MPKCKFIYHYWIDPRFGFISARIQTWFRFSTPICVNGREWLSRRMDKIGLPYKRYENSFPCIEDFAKSQTIMDRMQKINWPKVLDALAKKLNPAHGRMFRGLDMSYYWSAYQTEWAREIRQLVDVHRPRAERITLVMDNLNTHSLGSLYEAFPPQEAGRIINRLEVVYTPKHGSWLNMAEIELNVLTRQCLSRRIPDKQTLTTETAAWQDDRNRKDANID